MTLDKFIFHKIYIFFLRKIRFNYTSIMHGPLKGKKFNTYLNHHYLIGSYEIPSVQYFIKKKDKIHGVFYDLGANSGYMSIVAAQYNKQVLAFEPMPENLKFLNKHIKLNNIENIKVYNFAVGNDNGTVNFTMSPNLAANTYINSDNNFVKNTPRFETRIISLDNFILKENNLVPTIIKIDVEGAEYEILLGAKEVLSKYKPIVVLSTHEPFNKGVEKNCLNFLENLGYTIKQSEEIVETDGLKDYFCEVVQ